MSNQAPPEVVAIFGARGSGKSLIAEHMQNFYRVKDGRWDRLKFAGPIYDMARSLFGGELPENKEEPRPEIGGKSLREALLLLGTEFGRDQFGDNIWVDNMRRRIRACQLKGVNVVIDDLRYQNEFDMLRDIGAIVVRVDRENHETRGTHRSELDWQGFGYDFLVSNPGSGSAFDFAKTASRELWRQIACR